jgi:hypothetical protein
MSSCGPPCIHRCVGDALIDHISRTGGLPLCVNDCTGSSSGWYDGRKLYSGNRTQPVPTTFTSVNPSVRLILLPVLRKSLT